MEMRRYIRHSNGWWWLAAVCMAIAVCCAVKAAQVQKDREAMAPAPLLVDYRHIDAVYMTDWVYRVTDRSGRKKIFYFAGDADGYVYLVRLGDGQYAEFADVTDELPVRLAGVLCTVPKAYLPDLAEADGSTVEEYVDYYGDYYIDAAMTPADLNNGFYCRSDPPVPERCIFRAVQEGTAATGREGHAGAGGVRVPKRTGRPPRECAAQ